MSNGFVVTKEDWEHMSPEQQSYMVFGAIQALSEKVRLLERRPVTDKCFAFLGGIVGGFMAALGIKIGGQ